MNQPNKHRNSGSLKNLYTDQLAEQGIIISPESVSKKEQVEKELLEEAGQKDASWKVAHPLQSEAQEETNDYYNGMSQ